LGSDHTPAWIEQAYPCAPDEICILTSEPIQTQHSVFTIDGDVEIEHMSVNSGQIILNVSQKLKPGTSYELTGHLCDEAGNQSLITLSFHGWNPDIPEVLINEFTTRGSKAHPDTIELLVLTTGNTAGLTLYDGTPKNYRQMCILPAHDVSPGDYLIIHCRRERQEEVALDQSYQFFMDDDIGLSGNNGTLTLCTTVRGTIMDAVVYSNRYEGSDSLYGGFASSMTWENAQLLGEMGQWHFSMDTPRPEEAVRTEDTSATRSLNRCRSGEDTNRAGDWHTAPTSGSTFGFENTAQEYEADQPQM
jgi:hypothetical protein